MEGYRSTALHFGLSAMWKGKQEIHPIFLRETGIEENKGIKGLDRKCHFR
jgi:hypothetical protein